VTDQAEPESPATRLAPGDIAPEFVLPDADGVPVALSSFRGSNVIIYFYPAAGTPGCTTQADDFRDALPELAEAGFAVVGISPDLPEALARFRDQESLTFPLLSDPDLRVLTAYGAYGPKTMYGRRMMGVIRSTIVVDPGGVVTFARYNVRASGHVELLRRELSGADRS